MWSVGARRAIRVDVRIVVACNRDLAAMVDAKEFRQDLYFRLNVVKIILLPLRARGDDLLLLAQHFLDAFKENMAAMYAYPRERSICFRGSSGLETCES